MLWRQDLNSELYDSKTTYCPMLPGRLPLYHRDHIPVIKGQSTAGPWPPGKARTGAVWGNLNRIWSREQRLKTLKLPNLEKRTRVMVFSCVCYLCRVLKCSRRNLGKLQQGKNFLTFRIIKPANGTCAIGTRVLCTQPHRAQGRPSGWIAKWRLSSQVSELGEEGG